MMAGKESLLALPVIPLWAFGTTPVLLAIGAFLMQVAVQGAWGVVPAHLNELSPEEVRGTFPGFTYQLGNLLSSRNAVFQEAFALRHNAGSLKVALSGTVVVVAILVACITALGPEAKGADLSHPPG